MIDLFFNYEEQAEIYNDKTHVVNFSGGRTSAYLVYLMEQKRINEGWDVHYIYMDTGAEHPKTYEFIRNIVEKWNIKLTCIRMKLNPTLGKGNSYEIIHYKEMTNDLIPWKDMLSKYGTPYLGGAFCTNQLKLVPYIKYCNELFGRRKYITWLGIREDEPKRLKDREGYDFLASISDFHKDDILDWWEKQKFDLDIPEYLGNCMFCIKKGHNKLALAAKDEPKHLNDFIEILRSDNVRNDRELSPELMYRNNASLESIVESYKDIDRDELYKSLRSSKRYDSGSCSESCEIFNDDVNLGKLFE